MDFVVVERRKNHCYKDEHGHEADREKHHLTASGGGAKTVLDYAFRASDGPLRKSGRSCVPHVIDHEYVTVDDSDHVDRDIVTGTVAGGGDSYLFHGDITAMRCDDGVRVYLDGERFRY
jgi:hypothetical protein